MSKKLTPHKNELALIIDKPLLKILNIDEQTDLEILIENQSLIIRPINKKNLINTFEMKKITEEILSEYSDLFKKLAK